MDEVLVRVWLLDHPVGHLDDLLAEMGDRLLVHVGLGDELREGNWWFVSDCVLVKEKGRMGRGVLTQEAAEMLRTVGLVGVLARHFSSGGLPELDHLEVLSTLESIEY